MATYRAVWAKKDRFGVALFGPILLALGGYMVVSRLLGVVLTSSDKGSAVVRPMSAGEQYGVGGTLVACGALMLFLLVSSLFARVEWEPPRVVVYDWRNRVVFSEATSDLDRIVPFDREVGTRWYRVQGLQGTFEFPARWRDSAQLVERIAEAIRANRARESEAGFDSPDRGRVGGDPTDPARPAPR